MSAIFDWPFERNGNASLKISVEGRVMVNEVDLAVRAAVDGLGIAYLTGSSGRTLPALQDIWSGCWRTGRPASAGTLSILSRASAGSGRSACPHRYDPLASRRGAGKEPGRQPLRGRLTSNRYVEPRNEPALNAGYRWPRTCSGRAPKWSRIPASNPRSSRCFAYTLHSLLDAPTTATCAALCLSSAA